MAAILPQPECVNPLFAELFWENMKMYLHFLSFLDIEIQMLQVPQVN